MKIRKQKKYFWLNIPCAHQHTYMAWYGDIATTCKASKNGDEPCDMWCKRYKPAYPIKLYRKIK